MRSRRRSLKGVGRKQSSSRRTCNSLCRGATTREAGPARAGDRPARLGTARAIAYQSGILLWECVHYCGGHNRGSQRAELAGTRSRRTRADVMIVYPAGGLGDGVLRPHASPAGCSFDLISSGRSVATHAPSPGGSRNLHMGTLRAGAPPGLGPQFAGAPPGGPPGARRWARRSHSARRLERKTRGAHGDVTWGLHG